MTGRAANIQGSPLFDSGRDAALAAATGELLTDRAAIHTAAHSTDTVAVHDLGPVSFVSASYRVMAKTGDYVSHVVGADIDPKTFPLNLFHGASGPISAPFGGIIKPQHVRAP